MELTKKYLIKRENKYLKIHEQFTNKIKEAALFNTEEEAKSAAKDLVDSEIDKDYEIICLTGNEYFNLMTISNDN